MQQENNIHEALSHYYEATSSLFITNKDILKRFIGIGIIIPFLVLAIYPELINFTGYGFRIIFGVIALIVFGFTFFGGLNNYCIKATGAKIKNFKYKTFYLAGEDDMEQIIEAFNINDFKALSDVPSTDSGSLKIEIDYSKEDRVFFLLLKNEYYGKVNYLSEIKIFKDDEYDAYYPILKKI